MAHIPYGYKIENGHAVPEPEQAKKLNDFIEAYFGGLSIKESRKASGITEENSIPLLTTQTASDMPGRTSIWQAAKPRNRWTPFM